MAEETDIFSELSFGLVFREVIDVRDGEDRALDMMYRRALVLDWKGIAG